MNFAAAEIFGLVIAGICIVGAVISATGLLLSNFKIRSISNVTYRRLEIVALASLIVCGITLLCGLVSARSRYVTANTTHELTPQFPRGVKVDTELGEAWVATASGCWLQLDEKKIHGKHVVYLDRGSHQPIVALNQQKVDAAGRFLC